MADFEIDRNEKLYELIVKYENLTKYYVIKRPLFCPNHFEAICVANLLGFEEHKLKPLYKWCEDYELMIGGQGFIEVKEYKGDIAK